MVQILANPDKYDGKRVRFVGYVVVEFECHAIFVDQESYKHGILMNSVGLLHDFGKRRTKADKKYCLIEGVYKATPVGYRGAHNGSLIVSKVMIWVN